MSPSTSSIGGAGPSGPAGGGVSAADIIRLLYEAELGSDPLGNFDIGRMAAEQRRELLNDLIRRGEPLDDAEKDAIDRGDPEEAKRILKKVRQRWLEKHRRLAQRQQPVDTSAPERPRAPSVESRADGPPAVATPDDLVDLVQRVADGRASLSELASVDLRSLKPEQLAMLFLMLRAAGVVGNEHRALFDQGDANGIMELLRRLLGHRQPARRESARPDGGRWGVDRLRLGVPLDDPERLRALKRLLLALAAGGELPARGASGGLHQVPLLQFAPASLRAALHALGIDALVDFLARASSPTGRALLARALGLPVTSLLLAAHRAELLDLPIEAGRARPPHLKDLVLLARLGVTTVGHLGRLGVALEERPLLLEELGRLITMLQKKNRGLMARTPIGRHEFRDWAVACRRRGSFITVAGELAAEQAEAERAAEAVLGWCLDQRSGELIVDDLLLRLLLLLRDNGLRWQDIDLAHLERELGQQKIAAWRRLFELFDAQDRKRSAEELALFEEFRFDDEELSLFSELYPWDRPDLDREDHMICFWVDPIPDAQHLVSHGVRGAGEGAAVPSSLQAIYVCLDTQSGAIVPFGGAS